MKGLVASRDAEDEAKYRRAIASQAKQLTLADGMHLDSDFWTGIHAMVAGPWQGVALATAAAHMRRLR